MIFEKRKLKLETLSEYLSSVRQGSGLGLEEVAKQINIKPRFLTALEEGEYWQLPPDVYVKGFLKKLGLLYGIESEPLIEQYKKEKGIQQQVKQQAKQPKTLKGRLFNKFVITPKSLSLGVGLLFVVVTLGYIIWQVASINRTPRLEIIEPPDRQVIESSAFLVRGHTDPGMSVTINGQNVFVDAAGNFELQMGLSRGPKEFVVVSKNRFEKSATRSFTVIGEEQPNAEDAKARLKLEFSGPVTLTFAIDDKPAQTKNFQSGETEQLLGKRKIIISTSDAGATKASLNEQPLGTLGRSGEQLENIPFFAESDKIKTGDN